MRWLCGSLEHLPGAYWQVPVLRGLLVVHRGSGFFEVRWSHPGLMLGMVKEISSIEAELRALTDCCRHILVFVLPHMAGGNSPKSCFQYKTAMVLVNTMSNNKELFPIVRSLFHSHDYRRCQYYSEGALKTVLLGCWLVPSDCGVRRGLSCRLSPCWRGGERAVPATLVREKYLWDVSYWARAVSW